MPGLISCRPIFFIFSIAAAMIISSCSVDLEPAYVNFSKKMTEDQPGKELLAGSDIRVAVAAMISAQESVVYYHQLLDFIADRWGAKYSLSSARPMLK